LRPLSALFLAVVILLSCSERKRDFVRVGVDVDAGSLDPRLMRDTTAYRVVNLLYDGLIALDASSKPTPALAHRWDHPDDTTWIFHLRDDARFHNGTPVTAHDVVYTFETILDPSLGAPLRSLYTPIAEIEATDEHTVTFTLSTPYAPLLSYLELGIVPRGGEATIGSGPYRLLLWDRGAKIVLVAHDDYWGGAPSIPRIELLVVPDNTARAQAFEAGDLDLIQSPLASQDIRRLAEDPRFESFTSNAPAITYLNFNTARAPLDDPALRKALAMLVDQETILDGIYEGTDRVASSILLPSSWAFESDVRQPQHDAEAAAELLDELGWRDRDGDGFRERDGEPLAIELGTHSEDLNRVQTVEFLQNAFRKHGIDATIRISDWPSFSVRRDAGDYDIILLGWTQLVDPDRVSFDQLHTGGGLNWGQYSNRRLDALLESGRTEDDRAKRAEIYRAAAAIVAVELPYYVLSYQGYHLFTSARLRDYEADPRGMLRSLARSHLAPAPRP